MFELALEIVVTVAVLALYGQGNRPAAALPAPEPSIAAPVAEVPAVEIDEQITHQAAPDYAAMSIVELKALGKAHNVPGWKAWKKPATAIARLQALTLNEHGIDAAYEAAWADRA